MRIKQKNKTMKIKYVFLYAAIFFAFFSFLGVYEYKIYSTKWFILFFVYEVLFYLGLCSGGLVFSKNKQKRLNKRSFEISDSGAKLLWVLCLMSILSFIYFIYIYKSTLGSFMFGNYTANEFEERRSTLEKFTLLLMQIGGDCSFLILMSDKTKRYTKLKLISHFTLFLPGIRYLLMGARFVIAADFLILFIVKWPMLKEKLNFSSRAKREKRIIVVLAICLGIAFLYLFSSRAIYYTALERKSFVQGDMQIKPMWKHLYGVTNGRIDFLCTFSDYLGEAPFVFSYFCEYFFPENHTYGMITFRSIIQIFHNLTGLGPSYSEVIKNIASGQYSGFGYILMCEFGETLSFFVAYTIGLLFAKIERNKDINTVCHVIYPAIVIICFFAPIFYFYIGRLDYTILFCTILSPLCLVKKQQ